MNRCPYCDNPVEIFFGLLFDPLPGTPLHICSQYDGRLEVEVAKNEVLDRLDGVWFGDQPPSRPVVGVPSSPSDPHHHIPPKAA